MLEKVLSDANIFKSSNLVEIPKIPKNIEILKVFSRGALLLYELSEREPGWRFTARCHTETIAKRARVGPRTQIVFTMKTLFWIMFSSKKCLLITIIVLDNLLKLWIELTNWRNNNATQKFYLFGKVRLLVEISKISKNLEIIKNFVEGCAPALRVIRAGTRLTVHRSLP